MRGVGIALTGVFDHHLLVRSFGPSKGMSLENTMPGRKEELVRDWLIHEPGRLAIRAGGTAGTLDRQAKA